MSPCASVVVNGAVKLHFILMGEGFRAPSLVLFLVITRSLVF